MGPLCTPRITQKRMVLLHRVDPSPIADNPDPYLNFYFELSARRSILRLVSFNFSKENPSGCCRFSNKLAVPFSHLNCNICL